ncbi:hypothetical protein AYL99_01043 [Fonsecaea erecta]|uniref:Uncharacterized protein n=1 Tax=Fonsecaea erecta TaxID=1367422 RepID=A0A179A0E9_9EURO|nr:hypothetical protein AYL99_01043 [Fonsecaea erecta]OAP65071.1 hypothetical protein AYL99_01043 [Fonsecaea erecta]
MDPRHRGLYVQWCQSPRVVLLVGQDVGLPERFIIPEELLRRRSRTLREPIASLPPYFPTREIALPEIAPQTMEEFFIWNLTPTPQIDDRLSFMEVVQLGVFAWKYQVSALSNQVTDVIRHNLANNDWRLEPAIVDAIYQAAPESSPLREVVKAALGQMPRSSIDGEEWERTWKRNPDFGWDYHISSGNDWTAKDYLTGPCRFHNHDEVKRRQSLCDGCSYAQEDCYPYWEEDEEPEQIREVRDTTEETPPVADQVPEDNLPELTATEPAVAEVNGFEASVFEDAPEHAPEETTDLDTTVQMNQVTDNSVPEDVIEVVEGMQTPQADTDRLRNPFSPDEGPCEPSYADTFNDEGAVGENGIVTITLEEKGVDAVHVEAVNEHEAPVSGNKKKRKKNKKGSGFNNGTVDPGEVVVEP